jgi:glycosyltransferase involved in cell wall biosynthesis
MSDHVVLRYTKLFETDVLKTFPVPELQVNKKQKMKARAKDIASRLPKTKTLLKESWGILKYVSEVVKKYRGGSSRNVPDWLVDKWKEINKIENQLFPSESEMRSVWMWHDERDVFGRYYRKLIDAASGDYDFLFFMDSLNIGGTEKVILNYISAMKTARPEVKIALLVVYPHENQHLASRFAQYADIIDFGNITKNTEDHVRSLLMERLIIQLRAPRIFVTDTPFAYDFVGEHLKLFMNPEFEVNVITFNYSIGDTPGQIFSFMDPFLIRIYPCVNRIYTDNAHIIEQAVERCAFDPQKFTTHYQPIDVGKMIPPKLISKNRPVRILWAGRISRQKRPDLLKRIAEKLDPAEFIVDAYGRLQDYGKDFLSGVPALEYKGSFDGIGNLPTDQYDLYLYTSACDGLPNVLMEVAGKGLPTVASDVGGVGEFIIDGKSGILINDVDNVEAYVAGVKRLVANPQKAKEFVLNAQKILATDHSVKKFEQIVKRDILNK